MSAKLRLRIVRLDQPGSRLSVLVEPPIVLGRQNSCDIVLSSAFVSREHAAVVCENKQLVVRDLGSTNGTHVGGERVDARRVIDGERLRIGPYSIRILPSGETSGVSRESSSVS